MAKTDSKQTTNAQQLSGGQITKINKNNRKISGSINSTLSSLTQSIYGSSKKDEIDSLTSTFNDIMKDELDNLSKKADGDTTSFITKLFSNTNKANAMATKQMETMFDMNQAQLEEFLTDSYKNRLLKQSDLHEVASQLNELNEAILITRDSIVSADLVEGHMSRTLTFKHAASTADTADFTPMIEKMEQKFKLQEKIKNFIIPNTLEYGDYYVYVIPYSEIFKQFQRNQNKNYMKYYESANVINLHESFTKITDYKTLLTESVDDAMPVNVESLDKTKFKKDFEAEIESYMKNISICNESVPISILEEGYTALQYFTEQVMTEAASKSDPANKKNKFETVSGIDGGVQFNDAKEKEDDFSEVSDCYVKLIDPLHIIPVEIMGRPIGYYYIQEEDINPMSSVLTSSMYYDTFDNTRREKSIVNVIANQIVKSFDKKFLEENMKFKDVIVEALNYYNLNEKKIRFQYIPVEFIEVFKINEDENGRGTSIIEPALFNAKLYLMLLLFKIMSIILYSNDTKVNYIKQSGIEKDVANKIQEIARKKQQRQVNIMDMFSYTTLINKIGAGAEVYIPTGQSGERGIETEVIAGQDVQLHSDLLEMLRNAYISATGVPGVLMNYLNEAEFAKTIELANTRFLGRVVSNQLDFNGSITNLYKKIMKYSTSIPENVIESFSFSFTPPKSSNSTVSADLIQNFNAIADFSVAMLFTDEEVNDPEMQPVIRLFRKKLAKDRLPMLNIAGIEEILKNAKIEGQTKVLEDKTKPAPVEGEEAQ